MQAGSHFMCSPANPNLCQPIARDLHGQNHPTGFTSPLRLASNTAYNEERVMYLPGAIHICTRNSGI